MTLFNSDPNPKISDRRFAEGYANGYMYALRQVLRDRNLFHLIDEQKFGAELINQLVPVLNQLEIDPEIVSQVLRPHIELELNLAIKLQNQRDRYQLNRRVRWNGEGLDYKKKGTIIEVGLEKFKVAWDDGKTLAHDLDLDLIELLPDSEVLS